MQNQRQQRNEYAKEVAQMWQKTFKQPTSIKTVIYAVIGDKRSHRAVDAFKETVK